MRNFVRFCYLPTTTGARPSVSVYDRVPADHQDETTQDFWQNISLYNYPARYALRIANLSLQRSSACFPMKSGNDAA